MRATLRVPFAERMHSAVQRLASIGTAAGIVLLVSTLAALGWANSAWEGSYHHLWETPFSIGVGTWAVSTTLHHLINDGLMAVFFFLVGLEIKRELIAGELKSIRSAALPMVGALGGMVVPAAIYALVNRGGAGVAGWGVPMATDIAFALGVLALLGRRVPAGLTVFLAALAIVDDIGAVLVIALFYSGGVELIPLATVAALLLVAALANRGGFRSPLVYSVIGLALWAAVLLSGVHATVAGVLLAMTIPVRTRIDEGDFLAHAGEALDDFSHAAAQTAGDPDITPLSNTRHHAALRKLESLTEKAQPPLIRMEHALEALVNFGILPLFAFANAGISLDAGALQRAMSDAITVGALLGLIVGKPVGIAAFSWLAVRAGAASLPNGVTWRMIIGASVLGGIGFTMAIFISGLAFANPAQVAAAKVGILVASAVAGTAGYLLLRGALARAR